MNDIEYEEISDILDEYNIKFTSMIDCKGDVSMSLYEIRINPIYNQDIETLMHEFAHIFYEDYLRLHLNEDMIEKVSQKYVKDNPSIKHYLNCYIENRVEMVEDYKK